MVSVLTLSAVDRGFEPWAGQAKDYKIGIYGNMSIRGLLFQWASTIKIQLNVLV